MTLEKLIRNLDQVPEALHTTVRNNAGGDENHTMFWELVGPHGGRVPGGALTEAIATDLGALKARQEAVVTGVAEVEGEPILGVDVPEHANYLKSKNAWPA